MVNMTIAIVGDGQQWMFSNDWDVCEANGWLHVEDFDGWYGGVGAAVTPDTKRFQRHGSFPAPSIRGPRKMDLTLTWLDTIEDSLGSYSHFSRLASGIAWDYGPYAMTVREQGETLSTLVQLDGEIQHKAVIEHGETAFRIKIPLRAQDPFLYGPEHVYTVRPNSKSLVLMDPMFKETGNGEQVMDWLYDAPEYVRLTNPGTATAYPTYTVVADSPMGVRLSAGGQTIEYALPLFPNSPLTLDMSGHATMNDRDVSSRLRKREWHSIPPRGGSVTPIVDFFEGGSGYVTASVRPTYI